MSASTSAPFQSDVTSISDRIRILFRVWGRKDKSETLIRPSIIEYLKNVSQMDPRLDSKLASGAPKVYPIHRWDAKVAQVVPSGTRNNSKGPKGALTVSKIDPKGCPMFSKMGQSQPANFILTNGAISAEIFLSASGYAY